MFRKFGIIKTAAAFFGFLVIWESVSRSGFFNMHLFPPPSIVWNAFIESLLSGEFMSDAAASMRRSAIGFAAGSIIGIFLGLATGRVNSIRLTLGQIANFLRHIPSIAFVPLAIVWLGIGETSKVFLVAWGVIFPVWINTHQGMVNINKYYIWSVKSLGANKLQTLKEVIFPNAMPFIVTGMRVGIGMAFITLVAAEIAGAFSGIGYRISVSHLMFRVDKMIVGIVALGVLGMFADKLFVFTTKKVFPWIELR